MAQIRHWTGTQWSIPKAIKWWSGTQWQDKVGYRWTGTIWEPIISYGPDEVEFYLGGGWDTQSYGNAGYDRNGNEITFWADNDSGIDGDLSMDHALDATTYSWVNYTIYMYVYAPSPSYGSGFVGISGPGGSESIGFSGGYSTSQHNTIEVGTTVTISQNISHINGLVSVYAGFYMSDDGVGDSYGYMTLYVSLSREPKGEYIW